MEFSFKLYYKCFIVRTLVPPPPLGQISNTICRLSHFKSNAFLSANVFFVFSRDVTTRWIVKTFYVSYSFDRSVWPTVAVKPRIR